MYHCGVCHFCMLLELTCCYMSLVYIKFIWWLKFDWCLVLVSWLYVRIVWNLFVYDINFYLVISGLMHLCCMCGVCSNSIYRIIEYFLTFSSVMLSIVINRFVPGPSPGPPPTCLGLTWGMHKARKQIKTSPVLFIYHGIHLQTTPLGTVTSELDVRFLQILPGAGCDVTAVF